MSETIQPARTSATTGTAMANTKVVSLNCHLFKGSLPGTFARGLVIHDDERTAEICRRVAGCGADVVLLSEVWSNECRDAIVRSASVSSAYPHSWWPPKKTNPFFVGSGLVFLSRTPITDPRVDWFGRLSGWDWFSQKCVASVVIGGTVFASTHVNSGNDQHGRECRKSNLETVVKHAKARRDSGSARIVLTGDLCREADTATRAQIDAASTATEGQQQQQQLNRLSDEYVWFRDCMAALGLVDSFRAVAPDLVGSPMYTWDCAGNSLARRFSVPSDMPARGDLVFSTDQAIVPLACGICSPQWDVAIAGEQSPMPVSDHWPVFFDFRVR